MAYRTIVADPPWPMPWNGGADFRRNGRGERHASRVGAVKALPYPVMSIEEIAALPVSELAEPDAHLYLWAPDLFILDGTLKRVAEAWGWPAGRLLVWEKTGFGQGTFPRPQHEQVLVCRRGQLDWRTRSHGSVHRWKLTYALAAGSVGRRHSAKPEGFYDLVELASPGPYLELFARRQRLGWDTWGDEALNHVELAS